jgi:hypothetical protein
MQINQPDFPLTLSAFASALRTGHGRAMQQIKGHGSAGLEGAIIENCVSCTSYDPQCEAERAPWLFSIVDGANLKVEVFQAIAALLRDPPPEDHRDLSQRSAMLRELAVAGVEDARGLLYLSLACLPGTASVIGADDVVALDGVAGLIHVARQLGQWVQDDPDFWVDDYLIREFDAAQGGQDGLALLEREAATDPDIAGYLAGIHRTREERNNNAKRANELAMTGAQVVAHVKTNPKDQCHWFRRWGTQADPEQREVVYSALLETNELEQVTRLFRCFSKTGVPRFDTRLLPWIFHTDRKVQWVAVRAVASLRACSQITCTFGSPALGALRRCKPLVQQSCVSCERTRARFAPSIASQILQSNAQLIHEQALRHPELRNAALQLISNGDLEHGARLLVGNFEDGDLFLCAQQLEHSTDWDQCHSLGVELLALCEAHPCLEALDCLLYVYEFSPCSVCRYDAVKALTDIEIAPAWLLEEAAFDADPDTQALVLGEVAAAQKQE